MATTSFARLERIKRAERAKLVLADELCYEYGVTMCLMVANRAAKVHRRIASDARPSGHDIENDARTILGYAERLRAWAGNYVRGAVRDQPDEEVLLCSD